MDPTEAEDLAHDRESTKPSPSDEETAVPSTQQDRDQRLPSPFDPFEALMSRFPRLGRGLSQDWGSLWEDPFKDFEARMAAQRESFTQLQRWAREHAGREGGPYVWGYSLRVGPDGVPHIEHFGNTPLRPQVRPKAKDSRETAQSVPQDTTREPLTDIVERDGTIVVTLELPGVAKEDISLQLQDDSLEIRVERGVRRYHKQIRLPSGVDLSAAKASYNNGVLDVNLPKARVSKGKRLEIA